jgi:hypothetical protein
VRQLAARVAVPFHRCQLLLSVRLSGADTGFVPAPPAYPNVMSAAMIGVLAVFAVEYDLLPHTSEPSITLGRPLIDYLYYEIVHVHDHWLVLQALTQHLPAKGQE